ncbi:MFS-type transporter clz9-like [Homarus americanus]|uniref:MFS-type transporter clz9-like n=1 Tax=Homarus americanus TaxID=6706 RepID=UPI001C443146|nr:MFS-type transporter clz9-like [Homarus americanus]
MPRKYVRISNRGGWNTEAMQNAISAVKEKKMGVKAASKEFNVPKTTLRRRVKEKNKIATGSTKMLGPLTTVFSNEQEEELVAHILSMEDRFFGLTTRDVRYIAFQAEERNNLDHKFNKTVGLAGKDWLLGFLRRHPQLSIRTPEPTSAARARCFNQTNVDKFFDILSLVQEGHFFPPHRIFNVDETGITTVQTKPTKILGQRGKKQIGSLTSAERGVLATAVCCMSAGGQFVPIFPRVRMKQELKDGAPPGTGFACHPSGWMQLPIFTEWFQHFIAHTKPSVNDPVLLIMDGHMTHIKNLDVINLARDNYVTIVVLPPHCSHRMQPLDVSFMKPLNAYYVGAIETFLRNNPGRLVTIYKISALFGEAYLHAAVPNSH